MAAGGVVGRWSRLDGGAHVAMISIPMLLTRRGWLGWATPYFLSLFLRLTSLHALRPRFSSFPLPPGPRQPSPNPLAIFYSVIFASLPSTPFPRRSITLLLPFPTVFFPFSSPFRLIRFGHPEAGGIVLVDQSVRVRGIRDGG